jgi:hypothetical protein
MIAPLLFMKRGLLKYLIYESQGMRFIQEFLVTAAVG